MRADVRYQVTRFGQGFDGPGRRWLGLSMIALRRKLRRIDGPYSFRGESRRYRRSEVLERTKRRMSGARIGTKLVIEGGSYDQPAFAIRKVLNKPVEHELIAEAKRFLGGPYVFGAVPRTPGDAADCSGLTLRVVENVYGYTLPHSANLQMRDQRVQQLGGLDDLEPGDLIFYRFGRLPPGMADHCAFYAGRGYPAPELGSRPSTRGVGYCDVDKPYVIALGRLRKA